MVAKQLAAARTRLGLSAFEVARKTGLSPYTVYRVERGQTAPSLDTLARLAEAYGLSFDVRLDGKRVEIARAA